MTINKTQGQTIPNVGIFLPDAVFSNDQLYVVLSQATVKQHVKILAYPADHYTWVKGAKLKAVSVQKGKKGHAKAKPKKLLKRVTEALIQKIIIYKEVLT
jgi:ATP-dependent DNA helicase PIF1